jgi:hypothetical protein
MFPAQPIFRLVPTQGPDHRKDLLPIFEVQQDVPSLANLQVGSNFQHKVLLTNYDLLPILEVQQDVLRSANLQVGTLSYKVLLTN